MKKIFLFAIALMGTINLFAQNVWNYDFGNAATNVFQVSDGSWSTTFLPAPANGGGVAMVRGVNGLGGGNSILKNPSPITGTGTGLSITASSSTSVNKFSMYNYASANVATLKFKMKFSNSSSGSWVFAQGYGDNFRDGSLFMNSEVFAGLRFTMGVGGMTVENRASATWVAITGSPTQTETIYEVELYLNNSGNIANYTRGGAQTIMNGTYDLWINQTLVGNDLQRAGMPTGVHMNSFMFYGSSSSGNTSVLHLDDISYANYILPTMLPPYLDGHATSATTANYATNANQWNSQLYSGTAISTAPVFLMGYDAGAWKPIDQTGIRTYIGIPTGGETLQSAANRNNSIFNSGTADYGLKIIGNNGISNIFLAGQSGFSNGFTVGYNGTDMQYSFLDGKVGIGTTAATERLTVKGKIQAEEIRVKAANVPDYVFEENYSLLSLSEIEKYVKSEKHLPEVPSAKEFEKNGMEVGEMNKLLLKKIEELTLHLITKDKELTKEQVENQLQKDRLTKLEKDLLSLKALVEKRDILK